MFFGIDIAQVIEIVGYPGIFAIVLAESGLFFGVSLPGGSMLFTAGFLASQGYLHILILLVVVIVAAILGDTIGYWFGSWVGPALWRRPDSRFFKKAYLEQTRDFFDKHGSRTILLARFIPVVRTFAPILAGVAQMNYRTFFFYNSLGAVIWGGGFVIAGYTLGQTVPGIEKYMEIIILGIVFVTMIPLFVHMWQARRAKKPARTTEARAIIFDLDDTLADSFTPPTEEILAAVLALTKNYTVAIMSGAHMDRVERDVTARIHPQDSARVYIFSDSAARCTKWNNGSWQEAYSYPIAPEDRVRITNVLKTTIEKSGIYKGERNTSRILERETSIAFTGLPEGATQLEKREWDTDGAKKQKLMQLIRSELPDFEVFIAGKTTIDVTREGVNKAHGVTWLAKELSLKTEDMLFIGDAFYTGGNDAIVIPTGIQTIETSGPTETLRIIHDILQKNATHN